jgi:hypothetical protein
LERRLEGVSGIGQSGPTVITGTTLLQAQLMGAQEVCVAYLWVYEITMEIEFNPAKEGWDYRQARRVLASYGRI